MTSLSTRSCGRRPKSTKARSRGRLGRGDAASYGIWPARVIMIGWWSDHNFSVAARSLLIRESTLRRCRDFKGLRVAKISHSATSALRAWRQPLYRIGRACICASRKDAAKLLRSRSIQLWWSSHLRSDAGDRL